MWHARHVSVLSHLERLGARQIEHSGIVKGLRGVLFRHGNGDPSASCFGMCLSIRCEHETRDSRDPIFKAQDPVNYALLHASP